MFFGTAALFSLALAIGGLGPHAPLLTGLITAAAFPMLVAATLFGRTRSIARRDCIVALVFVLGLLAVGLGQLAPLPSAVWQGLPGRDVPNMVLETLGRADRPQPLSLAPEDTRLAIQSWLPPVAIFVSTMMATREERNALARLVVAAATASALLGLLQLSFGDGTFFLDPGGISDRYPGLFANYNHQAVFLASAVALLPPLAGGDRQRIGAWTWWPVAFWALALIGALITSSRAGLALFTLSSLVTAWRMLPNRPALTGKSGGSRRRLTLLFAAAVLAIATLWLLVSNSYRAELLGSRFETVDADARYEFWATTIEAIRVYFPYGVGFGAFEPVYQLTEPLEHVREYVVNHAHNDYLELILEAGAAGVVLLVLFALWFGMRLIALLRRRGEHDPLAWSGATIVALVLLHSLVDYPLRTEAVGCTFAFACALLLAAPVGIGARPRIRSFETQRIAA